MFKKKDKSCCIVLFFRKYHDLLQHYVLEFVYILHIIYKVQK